MGRPRRKYKPIVTDNFNLTRLKALQEAVQAAKDEGGEQFFRIELDGTTVTQKTSDPELFFKFQQMQTPYNEELIVEMYKGKGTTGDIYRFFLRPQDNAQENDNHAVIQQLSGIINDKLGEFSEMMNKEGMDGNERYQMQMQHQQELSGIQKQLVEMDYKNKISWMEKEIIQKQRDYNNLKSEYDLLEREYNEYEEGADRKTAEDQAKVEELKAELARYKKNLDVSAQIAPVIASVGSFAEGFLSKQISQDPQGPLAGLIKKIKFEEDDTKELPPQQQQVQKAQYQGEPSGQQNNGHAQFMEQMLQQYTPEQMQEGASMVKYLQENINDWQNILREFSQIARSPSLRNYIQEIIEEHKQEVTNKQEEDEPIQQSEATSAAQ